MQTFIPEELEPEILSDLIEEINELYEASEQTLIELELKPEDNELQRALFRSVHTIKGDLGLVNFSPIIPLLQHVEDLLDFLRKGQVDYTSIMSDLVLLTMDRVKQFVESVIAEGQAQYDDVLYQQLIMAIKRITPDNKAQHDKLLGEAVLLLNPDLDQPAYGEDEGEQSAEATAAPAPQKATLGKTGIPKDLSAEKRMDILFFREMMQTIEHRSNYWAGRGDRIAKLALYVNDVAGNPIEEDQLAVACYVHDFGMAFMPLKLLHKNDPYTDNEFNLMRSHVYKSSRLLEHLDQWDMARKIVMQHHERVDGSGYPLGLKEDDICDGAKLLAILDTFDAMTHSRARADKQAISKKKAVIELNRQADGKFIQTWLQYFNRAMAKVLTR
ncbi:MAG: metal-dependent phosphohydrolase [Alteromonadaceae bacterium]|nr:metal-dependent phosphohydrolase [Alteromonadaceae bacterium]